MPSLSEEFVVLSRQLGQAQRRCSDILAAQAAQMERLQAEVVRLRAAVVVRDTRLAMAHEALARLRAEAPSAVRRQSLVRHIGMLADRIAVLTRECLRWRLAAQQPSHRAGSVGTAPAVQALQDPQAPQEGTVPPALLSPPAPLAHSRPAVRITWAAADLVICQTGCISHDDYWRVQDHCRRTGKACLLVDQSLAARQADVLASLAPAWAPRATDEKEFEKKRGCSP